MENPHLIEDTTKKFLHAILNKCHEKRVQIYTYALNIGVFVLFVGITSIVLYYCYKRKPTEYEAQQKLLRDQQYILSKIRYYQGENISRRTSDITSLPVIR
jgi:hypothetical protein